jgi:hypothetical protein
MPVEGATSMARKIYILVAKSRMKDLDGEKRFVCRTAYLNRNAANNAVAGFKARCAEDRGYLCEAEPDTIEVSVVELELSDAPVDDKAAI